jgi:cytochrome c-type biogenesis protein CcsB
MLFFIGAILRWAVLLGYFVCAYLYIAPLVRARSTGSDLASPLLLLTTGLHALLLVDMGLETGRLTFLRTALQFMTLYAIGLSAATILVQARTGNKAFGAFAVPLATLLFIISLFERAPHQGIDPKLDSYWFEAHVMTAFAGYAAFGLAFVAAVMYLILAGEIQRRNLGRLFTRMPSLESLDQLGFRAVLFGFIFFTATLVIGGIWAAEATGSAWSGERKEIMSVVTWLVFAVYVFVRLRAGWRGRRTAILAILGFVTTMLTYLGGSGGGAGRHIL